MRRFFSRKEGKLKKPSREKSKKNMKLSRLLERIEVLRHTSIVNSQELVRAGSHVNAVKFSNVYINNNGNLFWNTPNKTYSDLKTARTMYTNLC